MSYKTQMHDGGESYSGVVPAKQPNESLGRPQEAVEGRPLTKENTEEPNSRRTQSRVSEPNGLDRVRQAARKDKELQFTTLLHHVDIDLLRSSYLDLKRQAAAGVDGMTWEEYGEDLEARLADLLTTGMLKRPGLSLDKFGLVPGPWSAVFIAERIMLNRRGESGYRKPMEGNDHWGSQRWKTKSYSGR